MNKEQEIEQEIQKKGLTAPRLTPEIIDAKIVDKEFLVSSLGKGVTTICVLELENSFTVTGESACVSKSNYDKDIGEKIAFEEARNKIWMLEGYLLQEKLYRE